MKKKKKLETCNTSSVPCLIQEINNLPNQEVDTSETFTKLIDPHALMNQSNPKSKKTNNKVINKQFVGSMYHVLLVKSYFYFCL